MKWVYRILRTLIVAALVLLVAVPALLYLALSVPGVQNALRSRAETELTALLGAKVGIGRLEVVPFNQVVLESVTVADPMRQAPPTLAAGRIAAGVDFWALLRGDIKVTYAELIDMDVRLWKSNPQAPLNIQPIIDKLSPKDKTKPPTKFELAITNVVIRRSRVGFDIESAPATPGHFNASHLLLTDVRADLTLPHVSNESVVADLRRLAFTEQSGLTVNELQLQAAVVGKRVEVSDLSLRLPNSYLHFRHPLTIGADFRTARQHVEIAEGAYLKPADLKAFWAPLASFDTRYTLQLDAEGAPDAFVVNSLEVEGQALALEIENAGVDGLLNGVPSVVADRVELRADAAKIGELLSKPVPLIGALGTVTLNGQGRFNGSEGQFTGELEAAPGRIELDGKAFDLKSGAPTIVGKLLTPALNLETLWGTAKGMTNVAADLEFDLTLSKRNPEGHIAGTVRGVAWKGYSYAPLTFEGSLEEHNLTAQADLDDPSGSVELTLQSALGANNRPQTLQLESSLQGVNLHALNLTKKYEGYVLSLSTRAEFDDLRTDSLSGHLVVDNIAFAGSEGQPSLHIEQIDVTAVAEPQGREISLDSDFASATLTGQYQFKPLIAACRRMVEAVEPQLLNGGEYEFESTDQAALRLTIEPDNELWKFLKLPVGLPAPLTVDANVDGASGTASVSVDAPYLSQGNKLIERTRIAFNLDARAGTSDLKLATNFPGKGGRANLSLSNRSERGVNTTDLGWVSETGVNHGALSLATTFSRDEENRLATDINLLPGGNIIFADTLWQVSPARIAVTPGRLQVDNFKVARDNQWLTISGASTADSTEQLVVELRNINLDYVFETLNISDNVMFGGQATGTLYASQLFSKTPKAFTDNLHVENLAYNHCVMGNGDIRSAFHPDDGSITIDADIKTPFTGGRSQINGRITPVGEKLDFRFHADKAPVGFLQPFMAAFCDKITGTVSGDAHLFGTFKLLDMEGRVVGHDLAMDLGFTGTTYHASDTVVINPGRIELPNITLTDDYGHTAVLSGWLTHNSFHDPAFNFNISDAHNFLCYSVKENPEHPWYGKVFGNGNASIDGKPGLVAINVNMATAPGTDFSFVLSDAEVAAEYDFLTFRDGRPVSEQVIVQEVDTVPPLVKAIRAATARKSSESSPTNYNMSFNIDVTPQAKMTLVMDPVGGDKIRAVGSGNMLMTYDAASEEMKMYGTYTVERGDYNFSLQDIIIKEFKIDPGSSIAFHGNPYTAQLDLRAYYALTANLTDLDESFGQDRDLARTTVPVRAMLYVTGDMRSPELSFDLNFPTLSQDTYRKVKSLISTDEMMNQQIIYLLALNRFYTPEYVAATRGSELASVASSTLSSRLSSILGTLSDKINVAPTFRTDRGDFSDMEVDVALSSSLLNNRLLLNGTLGYRDNTLNSNQFIGDFDVEYLLNRQGSIRLKAYNRYNDRNLYLKTALTTQGVGVVFKRDFDNIFSFLKPIRNWFRRKKSEEKKSD